MILSGRHLQKVRCSHGRDSLQLDLRDNHVLSGFQFASRGAEAYRVIPIVQGPRSLSDQCTLPGGWSHSVSSGKWMLRWKRECEGILREGARWVRPVREHGGGDGIGQGEPQAVMHSGWKSQPAQQGHPCPVNQSLGCLGRPEPQLSCCGSSGRPAAEGCQLPTPVQLRVVVHCLQGRAGALRVCWGGVRRVPEPASVAVGSSVPWLISSYQHGAF